mgnify:CR=1 FL=1
MVSTEYLASIYGTATFTKLIDIIIQTVYTINTLGRSYMRKTTRSILQELSDLGINRDTDLVIESRGSNIIQSAVNLLEQIRASYDIETAAELERRFINSIRTADASKFKRGIKRIQESKEWAIMHWKI